MTDHEPTHDPTPMEEWTDDELRANGGSRAAGELERRQHRRLLAGRRAQTNTRSETAIALRAFSGSRDPRDSWEQMARHHGLGDRVVLDRRRYEESARRVGNPGERLAADARAAMELDDQRNRTAERPDPSATPTGGWEKLTERAAAALAEPMLGERDPRFDHVDPDDGDAENRLLGDAKPVARYR